MNRIKSFLLVVLIFAACNNTENRIKRVAVAEAGNKILFFDEIPRQIKENISGEDSIAAIHNYANKWAKRVLVYQKAESNISTDLMTNIEKQLDETRVNLVVYEYQQQMMLEKMDTIISENELESYYTANENSFTLPSNIVKALFIKLPVETPNIDRIRILVRSNNQKDMQELESLCYQFAEKFDDYNEEWVTLDRISLEFNEDINSQENFLKRYSYYETKDTSSMRLLKINDYRLRGSLSPFDYVRDDIKRIIWNNRRIEFVQTLENGIYNDALKENGFKIF